VLIVDTGPLVATADRSDRDHVACRALLESDEGPLVTTAMVIAEAAYLIDRQLGAKAEASLYTSIIEGQADTRPDSSSWAADWISGRSRAASRHPGRLIAACCSRIRTSSRTARRSH
jgi:predicted nucleic acid-binding protein